MGGCSFIKGYFLKSAAAALIFLSLILMTNNGFCFPNEPKGFFSLNWGAPLSDLKTQFRKVKLLKDGDIKWYLVNSGYAQFSGEMTYLTYQFYEDKLCFVNIYFDEKSQDTLLNALKVTYGEPAKKYANGSAEWAGKVTGIHIEVEKNMISFWSKEIMTKRQLKEMKKELR